MRQVVDIIIKAQTAATLTSAAVDARNLFEVSAQVVTTGTGAGTLKIQASNDAPQGSVGPQNWSDITGASVAATGAGAFLIPKTDLCYEYIRFVYTNTGTGTVLVQFKALGD